MASSSSTWAAPTSLAPPPTCSGSLPVTLRGYWAGSPRTMFYPCPRKSWGGRLQPLPPAAAPRLLPPPPVPTLLPLPLPAKRQRRWLVTAPQKQLVKKLVKKLLQLPVEPAKVLFFFLSHLRTLGHLSSMCGNRIHVFGRKAVSEFGFFLDAFGSWRTLHGLLPRKK